MRADELTRTIEILFSPGNVVELRTFKDGTTFSGYFDDHDQLIKHAAKYDERGHDVYVTLNVLPEEIAYRRYNRVDKIRGRDQTTSDKDVKRRTHLFIDADCRRVSGISSTDEEKRQSREKVLEIRAYLRAQGWPEPIVCDSGNGYHLLYPIDLPNDQESLVLVAGVLEALDFKFSDEAVEVDTTTKNAARITKFYGTTAKKGDDVPERPHRPSKILKVPDELTAVSREQLEEIAAMKPEEPRGFRVYPGGKDYKEFDLAAWITRHDVPVKREGPWGNGGYRWILEECLNGHTDNSGYILRMPGGAIVARCHHNSCDYEWRDFREHYEPGAYDKRNFRKNASSSFGDSNDSNDGDFGNLVELPDPLAFPLDALPPRMRQYARESAKAIGCPVDYIGTSVLAAAAGAIGDSRAVVLKRDWIESALLFLMNVGPPSSKKTPAQNAALRPVRDRQLTYKREYERQKEEYESELRDYQKAAKNGPTELAKPTKPTLQRTYVDDTTVERLAGILNENTRGVLLTKDELSGWLRGMDQYKQGGRGADRQFWLSVHASQPVLVDRKTAEEPVLVPHPYVSIIGGIQPEVLPDFGKDRRDGLLDRFLPAYPDPQPSRWTEDEVSEDARQGYANLITGLYRLEPATNLEGEPFPSRVRMTDPAKRVFVREYNALHVELEAPGFSQRLRPVWGKLEAYLARLSLILALCRVVELKNRGETGVEEVITEADMTRAVRLLGYFKNHVRRLYAGLYGDNASDKLAADIHNFLVTLPNYSWEGTATELHEVLDSVHKPKRPEDLAKAIRAIAKRSPVLSFEELQRTKDRRPFRLTLEIAVTADTAVTDPAEEEGQDEDDEFEVGL